MRAIIRPFARCADRVYSLLAVYSTDHQQPCPGVAGQGVAAALPLRRVVPAGKNTVQGTPHPRDP